MVGEKKGEIEKRLQTSLRERDTLTAALEEASDRIHTLERHAREQETKLQVVFIFILKFYFFLNLNFIYFRQQLEI